MPIAPKLIITIVAIVACTVSISRCVGKNNEEDKERKKLSNDPSGPAKKVNASNYAGSAACASCHKDIFEQHVMTAHHLTSLPAEEENILGSFRKGQNRYNYNPALYILMEKTDTGLYQSVFYQGEKKADFRFDITTGSGAKGQTYLYWKGNQLFQMPISYFTAPKTWSVSPGFPPDKVLFDKPITSRCLECHATYAELISEPDIKNEEYDRNKIWYGVGCEKCHGPAAEHIAYHQTTTDSVAKNIIRPQNFSRQQKIDMCVVCHGGSMQKIRPSFSFLPGETLNEYFSVDTTTTVNTDNVDVHGNQYGLLRASLCFRESKTMTCLTCHSPHQNERNNIKVFSEKCMTCHGETSGHFCSINPKPTGIKQNCIDCHMPKRPSMAVTLFLEGQEVPTPAMIRSHFISIYPEDARKMRSVLEGP